MASGRGVLLEEPGFLVLSRGEQLLQEKLLRPAENEEVDGPDGVSYSHAPLQRASEPTFRSLDLINDVKYLCCPLWASLGRT